MGSIGESPPVIHVVVDPPLSRPFFGGGRHFIHVHMPSFVFVPHAHSSGAIGLENRGFCQIPFFPPSQNPINSVPASAKDQVAPVVEVEPTNNNAKERDPDKRETFGKLDFAGLPDFSKLGINSGKKNDLAKKLLENLARQFRINSKSSEQLSTEKENTENIISGEKKEKESFLGPQKEGIEPPVEKGISNGIAQPSGTKSVLGEKSLGKTAGQERDQNKEIGSVLDFDKVEGLKEHSIDQILAPAASLMQAARDVHQTIKNTFQEILSHSQEKKDGFSVSGTQGTKIQSEKNELNSLSAHGAEVPQKVVLPEGQSNQPAINTALILAGTGISPAENGVSKEGSAEITAINALNDKRELEDGQNLIKQGAAHSKSTEKTSQSLAFRVENDRTIPLGWRLTLDELMKKGVLDKESTQGDAKGKGESHRLMDVLFMILCAVVCGSRTIEEMSAFIESRERWFTILLGLRNGVPGHQLIWRLLTSIDFRKMDYLIRTWMREVQGASRLGGSVLPVISLWQTPEGIIFGQEYSESRSVALQAMQNIIQLFDMKHTLSMISSAYPLSGIVECIAERGGRSLFEVDAEDTVEGIKVMDHLKETQDLILSESYIEGRERMQVQEKALNSQSSLSQVLMEIYTTNGPVLIERFFSSNISSQAGFIFELLRAQRSVERKTEWLLNISMRSKPLEDVVLQGRENLICLRRYAIELVTRDHETPGNIQQKQALAARNEEFLLKLLRNF